jgi:hemolysin III
MGLSSGRLPAMERDQTRGEEIANSVSHGLGFAAVLVTAPLLIAHAARVGTPQFVVGVCIFIGSAAFLYLSSCLYHALAAGPAKDTFRIIEHSAIFVLIAGTYTPFMLGALRGPWGWTLVSLVWVLAVLGVLLKTRSRVTHPMLSLALYLGMGWLIIIAIRPLVRFVPMPGIVLILAGGLAYTVGTAFFAADRLRYGHFIWHLFVLTGTTCHFLAVWSYAA